MSFPWFQLCSWQIVQERSGGMNRRGRHLGRRQVLCQERTGGSGGLTGWGGDRRNGGAVGGRSGGGRSGGHGGGHSSRHRGGGGSGNRVIHGAAGHVVLEYVSVGPGVGFETEDEEPIRDGSGRFTAATWRTAHQGALLIWIYGSVDRSQAEWILVVRSDAADHGQQQRLAHEAA